MRGQLPLASYDINVTPDKRKTFLHNEKELLAALKASLVQLYEPSRSTFSVQDVTAGSNGAGALPTTAVARPVRPASYPPPIARSTWSASWEPRKQE